MSTIDEMQAVKLPKVTTTTFKILHFIGLHAGGATPTAIQKFIVESVQKRDWDPKRRAGAWNASLYGRDGIFEKFCTKVEKCWHLTERTALQMNRLPGVHVVYVPKNRIPLSEISIPRDLSVHNAEIIPSTPPDSKPFIPPYRSPYSDPMTFYAGDMPYGPLPPLRSDADDVLARIRARNKPNEPQVLKSKTTDEILAEMRAKRAVAMGDQLGQAIEDLTKAREEMTGTQKALDLATTNHQDAKRRATDASLKVKQLLQV